VDTFLDNAREIMAVAGATNESGDFAVLVRPDGGLHFIMEAPFTLGAAAAYVANKQYQKKKAAQKAALLKSNKAKSDKPG